MGMVFGWGPTEHARFGSRQCGAKNRESNQIVQEHQANSIGKAQSQNEGLMKRPGARPLRKLPLGKRTRFCVLDV
jgi:hypothetical protein